MSDRWDRTREFVEAAIPVMAVVAALVVGAGFIALIGKNPAMVYRELFLSTFGTIQGVGQVLFKTTPLILTGLAVAFGFRAGLFNIGAEGQLYIGSLLTAWVGYTWAGLPAVLLVPACVAAGFLGGAVWGGIPGWLKARFGVHEVINTIMMNFIALAFSNYLVGRHAAAHPELRETVHTVPIAEGAWVSRLDRFIPGFAGSPVNLSLVLALLAAVAVWYVLWRTTSGYELRAVGLNPDAARYGGINVGRATVGAMVVSGGLAGLVGVNFIQGYKHYFEQGFSDGLGFMGIAVALLGRNHPLGVVLAALLFGALSYGRLAINVTGVPKELVDILQAIIIIFVVVSSSVFRGYVARIRKRALRYG